VEVQGSYARVASPEQREGLGLDQRKQSVSARYISVDGGRYLLAEWARTIDRDPQRDVDAFAYETALVEGAGAIGWLGVAMRVEQTGRPEEERTADPFRTLRPSPDLSIAGTTQWRTATLALTLPSVTQGVIHGYPFVELERLAAKSRDARSVFVPGRFYGSESPWMMSIGVRLRYGPLHARMGRYGAAPSESAAIRNLGTPNIGSTDHHAH
jgi:hypothetical protein